MTMARINIVTLGVSDLAQSRAFYEALGWKASSASQESIVFLKGSNIVLALFGREALAHDAQVADQPTGFSAVTFAYNAASKAEVDKLFANAEAAGASALKSPQDVFWGGYSGYMADPDGHIWEIAFNPFIPFDENGNLTLPD